VTQVARNRTTVVVERPPAAERPYVLYWMIGARRLGWNFGLDRAVAWAQALRRPLLVFEPLDAGYPWASDRLHRFVLDGMADNAAKAAGGGIAYYPYVERAAGDGRGLLQALAARAAVVVTDRYPAFMLPRLVRSAARQVEARLEQVDSNGLLPLDAAGKPFATAYAFRRHLQRQLPSHIGNVPTADPLAAVAGLGRAEVPPEALARWPSAADHLSDRDDAFVAQLPIDHRVPPVDVEGGASAGGRVLDRFLAAGLAAYGRTRSALETDSTSGLSPYLHFGHVSSHEVVLRLLRQEGWLGDLTRRPTGAREGWWGVGAPAEAFLDQIVTWRELGFNTCAWRDDYDRYESLPAWARATLERHATDEREYRYTLERFEYARTHDALWNAAQRQLLREGRIQSYLRMLWGKKILEWTASPQDALAVMIELNNKYALDGRDPNSYSGIFWTLGRYDRPWAPERPVFGAVRYMSSASTARKMRVREYLAKYDDGGTTQPRLL
jgi:deoxyribodipyrimidine photo-lyase